MTRAWKVLLVELRLRGVSATGCTTVSPEMLSTIPEEAFCVKHSWKAFVTPSTAIWLDEGLWEAPARRFRFRVTTLMDQSIHFVQLKDARKWIRKWIRKWLTHMNQITECC